MFGTVALLIRDRSMRYTGENATIFKFSINGGRFETITTGLFVYAAIPAFQGMNPISFKEKDEAYKTRPEGESMR